MATAARVLPFPLPFRVGTDICQISRVRRILAGPRGPRFVRRVLADEEAAHPANRSAAFLRSGDASKAAAAEEEATQNLREAAVFMAGRFAAKEAAIKAHPHRHLSFHDVVVRRSATAGGTGSGAPVAVVKAAEKDGDRLDREALLSISHDGDYATAVCVAAFDPAAMATSREAASGPSAEGE